MNEVMPRIGACIVCATLFCLMTIKSLGAMQQCAYQNGAFVRWLRKKENMLFNRLCVLALCLALASAVSVLCFSFLGNKTALLVSAIPFTALLFFYLCSERKYALKVPLKRTGRVCRLFTAYVFVVACASYVFIAILTFLARWNGSPLYGLIAYVPFALFVPTLPFLLCVANAITGIFENARNRKFVKRAGQVLDETQIIRVGVVGSYGKTSVKNVLRTILSEKYSVVATPESYNTPIGIAKTVYSEAFLKKQVFIAELGARKAGDIAELCRLVKPDYAVFTGVCAQHIRSFGSVENAFAEKSEIIRCGAFTVCGESLQERLGGEKENVLFAGASQVREVQFFATHTKFKLRLGESEIDVTTKLLGNVAVENVALSATLAYTCLGLTVEEIARGIEKIQPIPHRLQLLENAGVYILDDAYNCNPVGAKEALGALARFEKGKCVVTPGIVECGVLEEKLNAELGAEIASARLDKVILVGDTLVGAVKNGYLQANGDEQKLVCVKTLEEAKTVVARWVQSGDCVLFLNDLPDAV